MTSQISWTDTVINITTVTETMIQLSLKLSLITGGEDSFYDTITTPEYDNAVNHGATVTQDPAETARQEEEWRAELEKVSVVSPLLTVFNHTWQWHALPFSCHLFTLCILVYGTCWMTCITVLCMSSVSTQCMDEDTVAATLWESRFYCLSWKQLVIGILCNVWSD